MSEHYEHKIISRIQTKSGDIYEPYAKDGDLFIPLVLQYPNTRCMRVFDMRIPHNLLKEALDYTCSIQEEAHWITDTEWNTVTCSSCGRPNYNDDSEFCPHCGKHMLNHSEEDKK